ncbi:MAG: hypothetical protein A3J74_08985 [Elusimicrobia bacterium RIFCSPHIGHO2_02_FULL_57_9]|nr:MAG: hypothetical protein A3J74_08985 [Elusimicrobia bacterium RIFCSPHIGHO2_02_FULL_57_9]
MKRYIFFVLALYGAYYYYSRHFNFNRTLEYAQKNQKSMLAQPIRYYGGLAYYQSSQYPKAQEAFSQLLKDHPTGYYTMKALFYLEDTAELNRDWPAARQALERYVEEFPDGKHAELMRKRLEILNYQHPGPVP